MPIVVSQQIQGDVNGLLDPALFEVLGSDGTSTGRIVTCASLLPANEENEDTTILLVGEFGDANDSPQAVKVIGDLLTEKIDPATGTPYNARGTSVAVTELEAGPSLVIARWMSSAEWERGQNNCPTGTRSIVQLTWQGGVVSYDGDELGLDSIDYERFTVTFSNGSTTTPFAFGDLNDNDNIVELCLRTVSNTGTVSVLADTVLDPAGDPNPPTNALIDGSAL
ncbi:MAG: hypothetical protein H7Z43_06300 [Clostridia bacterium]|nr:hypothetical protein [Deltaproteobacteria bacterium]